MGGRGSSGGGISSAAASGGAITATTPREIETTYFSRGSMGGARYKDEVLETSADKDGNLEFSYATPTFHEKSAKTNKTQTVTYSVTAGAINGETFGINWDKVNSISGQTYSLRQEAKAAGLKWNRDRKRWER